MAEQTILLDLKVSNEDAVKRIVEAQEALKDLKNEQKQLDKAYEDGNVSRSEYLEQTTRIKEETELFSNSLKANKDALKQNVREEQTKKDSLVQMRAELKKATTAYDNLSKAERESAKGQELLGYIKELTEEVGNAEAETQRFQRYVGEYHKLFGETGTTIGKISEMFGNLSGGTDKASDAFKGATAAAKAFGKQLLTLLANPIVAIVSAIVVVFMNLVKAIKRNDDASTALQRVFSTFKPVVDVLRIALDAVVNVIGKLANGIADAIQWVQKFIPVIGDLSEKENELVVATDNLEEAERRYIVNHSKREAEIAEYSARAHERDKYTAEERRKYLEKAIELSKKDLAERRANAKEELRLAKERARLDRDTSDETKNNIAQLEAALNEANAAYSQRTKEFRSQLVAFDKEEAAARAAQAKAAADAAKKRTAERKAAAEKELQEVSPAQDLFIEATLQGEEKEVEILKVSYQRRIEELKKRLQEEENLTAEARKAINTQIILLEAESLVKIDDVRNKWQAEREKKDKEDKAKQVEAEKKKNQEILDEFKRFYENYINEAEDGSIEQMQRTIQVRKQELDELHQMEDESYQSFYARQLKAKKAYNDSVKALNEAEAANEVAKFEAMSGVMGGFQQLMDAFGEDNKAAAIASKVLALGQVAVETGKAIATGTAQAMAAGPFPANLTAIATTVAAVLGQMATAVSTIRGAKFARGGYIEGAGTGTSDSIVARVSNGESVLTAKATAAHYDQLSRWNVEGGGVAFPNSGNKTRFATGGVVGISDMSASGQSLAMRQMIADAVANINPVVSVREITKAQQRVAVKERISKS